eukprot:2694178-Rhodomonas_salina.6
MGRLTVPRTILRPLARLMTRRGRSARNMRKVRKKRIHSASEPLGAAHSTAMSMSDVTTRKKSSWFHRLLMYFHQP